VRVLGTTRADLSTKIPIPIFTFLAFFTLFCFELAFGVNIKVLDKDFSFLMVLISLENDF